MRPFPDLILSCVYERVFTCFIPRTGHDRRWMKEGFPGCVVCLQQRDGRAPVLLYRSMLIVFCVMHYGAFLSNRTCMAIARIECYNVDSVLYIVTQINIAYENL